jgi:signal peptidase I
MSEWKPWKSFWKFFWHEDSVSSWIANIIVAFVLIRYIIYPVLGIVLGTSFPIVAVISESMEHGIHNQIICGEKIEDFKDSYANYWSVCGEWYEEKGITKEQFSNFPLKNGFNKGDVIILWRANKNNVNIGDVLVYNGGRSQPIIHRVIDIWQEDEITYYQTKGDHNPGLNPNEKRIHQSLLFGKGVVRIPYLGWLKILFVDAVKPFGIEITR